MKFLVLIIFIILSSCSSNNAVYICGERECLDKKEMKDFFAKNQILEIKNKNKKKDKYIDLVLLNTGEKFKNKKETSINSKKLTKDEIHIIKKERKLEKIKRKEEKKEKKRKTASKKNENKENKDIKIINKKITINEKKKPCKILLDCDIDEISKFIKVSGKNKDYPDITQ